MWGFENSGQPPADDMKLIVPNGMVELVIPVHNGLVGMFIDSKGNKIGLQHL